MLGLAWAVVPAYFLSPQAADGQLVAVAVIFAAAGIGSLALARRARGAILFCALLSGVAALISLQLATPMGFALAGFSLLYGAAIIILTRHSHAMAEASIEAAREIKKQNEIIALALNDFSEGASGWLWETDADGRLTYASRGLAAGTGLPHQKLPGMAFSSLFEVEAGKPGWDRLLLAMEARRPIECIVELPFGKAQLWWQVASHPVFGPDGKFTGTRGVAHNITAERNVSQKLQEEKEQALRDNARKSHFMATMSHELRTPLNSIIGFAELLMSPSALNLHDHQRREHLQTILDSSRHLQSLIVDVLDVTRIEKGKLQLVEQEVDAAEITEVAVRMCRDAAEKADTTIIASVVEGIELRCDATRFKQVLINLVTNAVKFSHPGGVVHVAFDRPDGGGLVISVHDDGIGIRPEDLARIFEPFVQADEGTARHFGGMGLGLPIARQIAMLHGGDVTIESTLGAGTTVCLALPACRVSWQAAQFGLTTRAA